jgi:hypothetical protein
MKGLGTALKRRVKNGGFLLGTGLMFLCLLAHSIPLWMDTRGWPIADRPSAMIFSLSGVFFGGVILVFPLCACAPLASAFNTKKKADSPWVEVLSAALSGGLCVSLPFILHTLICNLAAMPVSPEKYPAHMLSFYGIYNELYHLYCGLPMYGLFALGMMISGSIFALLALLTGMLIRTPQSVMAIPAAVWFLWLKFSGAGIPRPADIFSDALTLHGMINSFIIYVILFALFAMAYIILRKGGKYEYG